MNDHLAAPVRELLALYGEKYPEVQFPELDLAVLLAAATEVKHAVAKVADAEASLEPLREQVRVAEGELTQKVVRAISFLKVYVDGDEAGYAQLDALTQALLTRKGTRRPATDSAAAPSGERARRGRKPKVSAIGPGENPEVDVLPVGLVEADLPSSALTEFESVAK